MRCQIWRAVFTFALAAARRRQWELATSHSSASSCASWCARVSFSSPARAPLAASLLTPRLSRASQAEEELIEIVPTFSEGTVAALTGDLGPFTAGIPVVRARLLCVRARRRRWRSLQPATCPPPSPRAGGAAVGGAAAQGGPALPRGASALAHARLFAPRARRGARARRRLCGAALLLRRDFAPAAVVVVRRRRGAARAGRRPSHDCHPRKPARPAPLRALPASAPPPRAREDIADADTVETSIEDIQTLREEKMQRGVATVLQVAATRETPRLVDLTHASVSAAAAAVRRACCAAAAALPLEALLLPRAPTPPRRPWK